jgi:hypothetical protein
MLFSPYPWYYTVMWPFYYRSPSVRNYTKMPRVPDQYRFHSQKPVLRLLFCGDIMVQHHDKPPMLHTELCDLISSTDYFIGNCEAPLGTHKLNPKIKYKFNFHMPRDYLNNIVLQTGLPHQRWLLSIANNHIADQGQKSYEATYHILSDMGITPLGRYDSEKPFHIIEKNQLRIGFSAWTQWLNCPIFKNNEGVHQNKDIIMFDWKNLKSQHQLNYLFGLPHWEYEFQHFPRRATRLLAHSLVNDKGMDFIIGSHTHTLQAMEWFKQGFCAYNLGNFCGYAGAWSVQLIPLLEVNLSYNMNNPLHSYRFHYFVQQKINNQLHIIPLSLASNELKDKLIHLIHRLYKVNRDI